MFVLKFILDWAIMNVYWRINRIILKYAYFKS